MPIKDQGTPLKGLNKLRRNAGMSIRALAEKTDMSYLDILQLERLEVNALTNEVKLLAKAVNVNSLPPYKILQQITDA